MRGIVVLCGCAALTLAAHHADAKGDSEQSSAQHSIANSLQNMASRYDLTAKRSERTEKEEAKCDQRKYGSNTDLCAQWKAADAASDSAWWAWAVGVLGIFSLMGVFFAIGLAYQANHITRDTAKRQLRAYLVPGSAYAIAKLDEAGRLRFRAHIEIKNAGITPAMLNCCLFAHQVPGGYQHPGSAGSPKSKLMLIGPGIGKFETWTETTVGADEPSAEEASIMTIVGIAYTDFANRQWLETIGWRTTGPLKAGRIPMKLNFHNEGLNPIFNNQWRSVKAIDGP